MGTSWVCQFFLARNICTNSFSHSIIVRISVGHRFVRITSNTSNLMQNRRDKIQVYFSGVYLERTVELSIYRWLPRTRMRWASYLPSGWLTTDKVRVFVANCAVILFFWWQCVTTLSTHKQQTYTRQVIETMEEGGRYVARILPLEVAQVCVLSMRGEYYAYAHVHKCIQANNCTWVQHDKHADGT